VKGCSKYAKKNISTKQSPPRQEARLSCQNGNQKRTRRPETPSGEGTQNINGQTLLDFSLPKACRLRKSAEFRRVYSQGKRFDGRLMTVFLLPSEDGFHKLGITASKKGIGNAVARNRAKRLLREAFRLSGAELGGLQKKYEWVLNARRGLLRGKLEKPLQDFRQIIETVKNSESELTIGAENVAVGTQKQ
jgi:ribonuclease P protein component